MVNRAYGVTVISPEQVEAMPIDEVNLCTAYVMYKAQIAAGRKIGSREGLALGESRDAGQD